jgi:hypothetical protein
MISGLNSSRHGIGGTIGIAILSTIAAGSGALAAPRAASGIDRAFLAGGLLAGFGSVVAPVRCEPAATRSRGTRASASGR